MATVIDSLLIELGLDTSKFDSAQKKSVEQLRKFDEQANKTAKNTQQGSKNIGEGFEKAKDALLSLGVALVGVKGFTSFVGSMTTGNAALGRNANLLSMSARELDAWGGVLKSVGGNVESFQGSMQAMQQGIANVKLGDAAILTPLARLGALSSVDLNKNTVDVYKLADALKRFKDQNGEQLTYTLAQQLGLNKETFMVLEKGSESVRKLYGENYKLSGINEKNAEAAQKFQAQLGLLSQAISGASNEVMDQLYPSLGALVEGTSSAITKLVEWDKQLDGGISKAGLFAAGIGSVMSALKFLGISFTSQIATIAKWGSTIEGIVTAGWFTKFLGAAGLMLHSEDLNKGEDEEMAKIHAAQDKALGITRNAKTGAIEKYTPSENPEERKFQEEQLKKMGVTYDAKTGNVLNNGRPATGPVGDQTENFKNLEGKYNLPPGMLDKIWKIESGRGKGDMVSPAGATGHFQFMPETAKQYGMNREDTFDINKSSDAAARMFSDLLKKYKGNTDAALAAYNWGSGNLDKYGMGKMPEETRNYLKKYHEGEPGVQTASNANQIPMQHNRTLAQQREMVGAKVTAPAATTNNNNIQTTIGTINVQTQATDANSLTAGLSKSLENNSLINYGMQGNR